MLTLHYKSQDRHWWHFLHYFLQTCNMSGLFVTLPFFYCVEVDVVCRISFDFVDV